MRSVFVLSVTALLLAGCSGGSGFEVAPVAGTVTLDGEPLSGATVTFLPQAGAGQDAGPASTGQTDASGKFVLATGVGETGAVVGKHQVMITTVKDEEASSEDDNVYSKDNVERVPSRYNASTTLTIDVPAAGNEAVTFDLTTGEG